MRIGIPRERLTLEGRVALVPDACGDLIKRGHEVLLEFGAGHKSGYPDEAYQALGVTLVGGGENLYGAAQLIVKVKEPQVEELPWLRRDHRLFCFLHLAAYPHLVAALKEIGLTAIGFETVQDNNGHLPILSPMSTIAGRLSIQIGATLLHAPQGGRGVLLGGLPGAERGEVVVFGAGSAGGSAAEVAAALGGQVTVFDLRHDRLQAMERLGPNVTTLYPYPESVRRHVMRADLLIGAVLVTGRRAPRVVDEELVKAMQPGSVIMDISVDQGGCVATTRPTNYALPTYRLHDVVHFAVTNMPGAVPRSASQALSAILLPYVVDLTSEDWSSRPALAAGINIQDGKIVHPALTG